MATGNPLIIEKCQLEMDVSKLKLIKSSFLSQKYDLEDKILKTYPAVIKRLTERIAGYKKDIETVKAVVSKDGYPMTIDGTLYPVDKKKEAGTAILAFCKAMTSPDPVPLGHYRGFDMDVSFDSFNKVYTVALKGSLTHTVDLGTDIFGNITRLDNALEGMEPKLQSCREQLESAQTQMETAKVEVEKPFPQEAELTEKSTRLNEINIALNLDKRENELVDSAPDEGDNADAPQRKERERDDDR